MADVHEMKELYDFGRQTWGNPLLQKRKAVVQNHTEVALWSNEWEDHDSHTGDPVKNKMIRLGDIHPMMREFLEPGHFD